MRPHEEKQNSSSHRRYSKHKILSVPEFHLSQVQKSEVAKEERPEAVGPPPGGKGGSLRTTSMDEVDEESEARCAGLLMSIVVSC